MQACVIKEPFRVAVEQVPKPVIENPTDAIVKVELAALCGSDLHPYRGHYNFKKYDFIMGHEFIGEVVEVGSAVTKIKAGDKVVSPFSILRRLLLLQSKADFAMCCELDTAQNSNLKDENQKLFGSPLLEGLQAEFARIPLADAMLFPAPSGVAPEMLLLMADIFPTGYWVASNAKKMLEDPQNSTVVVIGCGPVGLCAITAAKTMFKTVYATDLVEERRAEAIKHGAVALPGDQLKEAVLKATEGRGADAVLEVVGVPAAVLTALDLVRPFGVVASCGVHTKEIKIEGSLLYNKNVRLQFGRCPVQAIFPDALKILQAHADLFKGFVAHTVPLSKAAEYYTLFEQNKIMKTAFVPGQ